jgi:diadenosine tetraphosphate (Ap4A) HIT family hydrolase
MRGCPNCKFCSILEESRIFIWNDANFGLIRDIKQDNNAALHLLVVPLDHQKVLNPADCLGWTGLFNAARTIIQLAKELLGPDYSSKSQYKLELNSGPKSGQTLLHTHLHVYIFKS